MADSLSDLMNEGEGKNAFGEMLPNKVSGKKADVTSNGISSLKVPTNIKSPVNGNKNIEISSNKDKEEKKVKITGKRSLFDKYALLDYGRYITNSKWEDWKSTGENDSLTFGTNTKFKIADTVTDEDTSEITVPNLIKWSESYPALQLRFQDFAFCKKLGYFPNNRLIVLRRFKAGVPDNLFNHYIKSNTPADENIQPISTLVTWFNPDEIPFSMSFNEVWETQSKGLVELLQDAIKTEFENAPKAVKDVSDKFSKGLDWFETIRPFFMQAFDVSRTDGIPATQNAPDGDPNLIYSSGKRRLPKSGKGLTSTIRFNIKFEYEMRYINGVDPSMAMLDLISNCIRMGTSVGHFRLPIKGLSENALLDRIIKSNFTIETDKFVDKIKNTISEAGKKILELINKASEATTTDVSNAVNKGVNNFLTYATSRYREDLKAALAADTGVPSGIWHITIGNPKKPIISCGDLIIESTEFELGKELGYNDFPNSFFCKYTLSTARERGRDELERIFNSGRGRLYVYPKANENPDNFIYKK